MTQSNNWKVDGLAIGVRFNPTFAIGDNLGKIVDKILYSPKAYFDPKIFGLTDSGINEVMLKDLKQTRYLYISTTDIILELRETDDFSINLTEVEAKFEEQILNAIFAIYEVREIQRMGFLTRFSIPGKEMSELFIKKAGVDANNIVMRFQKNYPMPDAMAKKTVNDYCSNIYTITKKAESDVISVNSDYQVYFQPFLEDYREMQFKKYIESKSKFNSSTLPNWISQYLNR